ncbi:hypothetical protein Anas_03665 [Armadillidium nasatum]|uniref:Uncharacterized protein n=1 Tax=Armadillidium nasatum TaxID=96803 RepID=A0A5N5SLJ2_9CRUS|nr:hypothetical protein Anas_03665 [Armadillidium nasatum]
MEASELGMDESPFLTASSTTTSLTTTLTTTTTTSTPMPTGAATSPEGTLPPDYHMNMGGGAHERLERPSSLLAPAGKWPVISPTSPDSHTSTPTEVPSNTTSAPNTATDAAPSSTTMCGGRHSRWLLCVSVNNVTGEQYQPTKPTSPPGVESPNESSPQQQSHASTTPTQQNATTAPRTLPSPSCNLAGCFLKSSVHQVQNLASNRSPSPHLPPGLPSPLPPGYPSPTVNSSGGDVSQNRLGPPVEGGVAVLPTELPPRLHPVHQRDTYTFHGGGQEPQGHYVNPQSGLLSSNYASSANQRGGPLPEPPIPVSEIGPIPPPPMFSSPSPLVNPRAVPPPPYHPPSSGASVQSAHGIDHFYIWL